jgi:hypothetical protein
VTAPEVDEPVREPGRRLSHVLTDIARERGPDRLSIADLRDALGDRAFGALLILFAAPNALPVNAPGVSTVLGAPLLFLALQMIVGLRAPWLPGFMARRTVRRESFAKAVDVIVPWIRRAERLLRPRMGMLARGPIERLIGGVCAVMALVLMLPIPFGNMPPAVAICILALAVLEEDGVATLVGLATAAAALFIVWGVIFAIVKAVSLFLRHLFGW